MPYDIINDIKEFYENDPLQKRFSALVTGETGSGKTYLLRSARMPIHIDSFDPGGTKCLRSLIKKGDVVADTRWENEDPYNPTVFNDWIKETDYRFEVGYFDKFGTYALDSSTTFADAVMNSQLEKFGPDFTSLHALYAKEGEIKFGEDVFSEIEISDEDVRESAKILVSDAILQWEEIINTAREEGLPDNELEYLVGAPIINIAFALCCYKVGTNATKMDLVKPDIHEEIKEVWGDESDFSPFYPMLQQAHAFKLGIRLPESQNFLQMNIDFIKKVIKHTKLQAEE